MPLIAELTSLFGVVALLLAAIGRYCVTAYALAQRTGEIGTWMALSADRTKVTVAPRPVQPLGHRVCQFSRINRRRWAAGPVILVIIGAVAEFERNLIIERVRAGMRAAAYKVNAWAVRPQPWTVPPSFTTSAIAILLPN